MGRSLRIALLIVALCPLAARADQFSARGPGNVTAIGAPPVSVLGINFSNFAANCSLPGTCDPGPDSEPLALGTASAAADRGILKAKSACHTARTPFRYPGPFPNPYGGLATWEVNDVRISGPANPAGVPAMLHMILEGNLEASGGDQFGTPFNWGTTASVGLSIGSSAILRSFFGEMGLDGNHAWGATGILSSAAGPGLMSIALDLDLGLMPVNVDLTMSAQLDASVGGGGFLASSAVETNFFDQGGLHFISLGAGPVMTLPPGYTVDIPSLNVVHNSWGGIPVSARPRTWGALKVLYR
jgi:hypothetical protein